MNPFWLDRTKQCAYFRHVYIYIERDIKKMKMEEQKETAEDVSSGKSMKIKLGVCVTFVINNIVSNQ